MSFKEKIEPLDKLFTLFFLFSPIVIGIATSFGMDLRLLWFPMIAFMVWTLYIYWYRGKYVLFEQEELSLIERVRGLMYFFGLVATFVLNGFVVFYPTSQNQIIVIVLVGWSLWLIEKIIPRTFFSKQTRWFNRQQEQSLQDVLSNVGSVAIFYSMIVSLLNYILIYLRLELIANLVLLTILSFLILIVYQSEAHSRKLAKALAISLKEDGWMRRYLGQRKIEERRRRKKKKPKT
jgi:hypothetical protein